MSTLQELVNRNRSFRRFLQSPAPDRAMLEAWIQLARLTASGGNLQPIRYWLVASQADCAAVFPHTRWAGLLKGWQPGPDEAPTAYILLLTEAEGGTRHVDAGIAMQTILLAAVERGFGGCMLGAIERAAIKTALGIPGKWELLYAVALGKPAEVCRIEDAVDGKTPYYRTADGMHHVPKLPLNELILNL